MTTMSARPNSQQAADRPASASPVEVPPAIRVETDRQAAAGKRAAEVVREAFRIARESEEKRSQARAGILGGGKFWL